jgi:von Willebrand factor type A domain
VFVVIDTSRSMRAGDPPRLERALTAVRRLRVALADARVGVASMTDRVLPHLFPTADLRVFDATAREAIAVDSPPPVTLNEGRATFFGSLGALATGRFFSPSAERRVAVVVTDGETRAVDAPALDRTLGAARIRVVFLQVWRGGERIRGDRVYRSDAAAPVALRRLARLLRAPVCSDSGAAARAVHSRLGRGRRHVVRTRTSVRPLAPWAVLAAVPPLGFLLLRRLVPVQQSRNRIV